MTNVGYATLTVVPSAKGFASALGKDVNAPLAAAGRRGGLAAGQEAGAGLRKGMLPAVAKLGVALGGAFAAVKVGGFLSGAIAEASDLSESVNAIQVSYGKAAEGVLALGDDSARAFGLSKVELNNFAVRFSGFANGLAGETGDAAEVFKTLAGRATDFASVMNLEVSEAAGLFQSGLAGETEPLRRFGIDMSAATVQAFAYSSGIAKSGEKLTEAQKQQARYALLMEQTNKVAGDFENTSGGLANQQRILSAQWANLKSKVGEALVPILAKVTSFINDKIIPTFSGWAESIGPLVSKVGDFFKALGSGEGAAGGVADFLGRIRDAAQGLFDLIVKGDFTGAFARAFNVAEDSPVVGALFNIRDAFVSLIPSVVEAAKAIKDRIVEAVSGVLPTLKSIASVIFGTVGPALLSLGEFIGTTILPALLSFGRFIGEEIYPRIIGFVKTVGDNLMPAFRAIGEAFATRIVPALKVVGEALAKLLEAVKPVIKFIVRLAGIILGVLSKALGFIIPIVLKLAGPVFSFLIGVIGKVIGWVAKIIGWIGNFANKLLDAGPAIGRFASTVAEKIGDVIQWFRDLPGKIGRAIKGFGTLLVEKGKDLIRGLINGATSMLSRLGEFFLDKVPGWIKTPFKKALGIASPSKLFAEYGANVGEGFVKGIRGQERAVRSAALALGDSAGTMPTLAVSPPKVPAAAGAAGASSGASFAPNINIHYPEPERASEALPVALRRAAFVAGF